MYQIGSMDISNTLVIDGQFLRPDFDNFSCLKRSPFEDFNNTTDLVPLLAFTHNIYFLCCPHGVNS